MLHEKKSAEAETKSKPQASVAKMDSEMSAMLQCECVSQGCERQRLGSRYGSVRVRRLSRGGTWWGMVI